MERDEAIFRALKELEAIERHHITPLSLLDNDYPVRLAQIPDAPVVLYKLGDADLDSRHIVNLVGTRRSTPYGLDFCKRLISDLAPYFPDLVVVSGLAFGIDAAAHQAALDANVKTVAVVAHGLNMIYPAPHRSLAKTIIQSGVQSSRNIISATNLTDNVSLRETGLSPDSPTSPLSLRAT